MADTAREYILVCKEFNGSNCTNEVWTVKEDISSFFVFNKQDFAYGFSGILSLFAIGFGVGVIMSILKKAR
ncbi:hypothetical protein VQ643_09850 [Pseudomonas sp. F1_0610]|uniref:hypothetical protein n=1 Tax=Pseudomonas sp. F1_0610 TaxID=3114284 RepID=UPI0039C2EB77